MSVIAYSRADLKGYLKIVLSDFKDGIPRVKPGFFEAFKVLGHTKPREGHLEIRRLSHDWAFVEK